jgi:hypothetical protein
MRKHVEEIRAGEPRRTSVVNVTEALVVVPRLSIPRVGLTDLDFAAKPTEETSDARWENKEQNQKTGSSRETHTRSAGIRARGAAPLVVNASHPSYPIMVSVARHSCQGRRATPVRGDTNSPTPPPQAHHTCPGGGKPIVDVGQLSASRSPNEPGRSCGDRPRLISRRYCE